MTLSQTGDESRRRGTLRAKSCALVLTFVGCTGGSGPGLPASLAALREQLPVREEMNVIVISFDALRPDELGAYGQELDTSPNIDRFAEQSLRFENAYSVSPVTPTSFATAFTGMLPTRVFQGWKLVADKTMASRFSEAGFRSAGFTTSVQLTPKRDFDRGFDEYHWMPPEGFSWRDGEMLEHVKTWLREHRSDRFFLWVHFHPPHTPYSYRTIAEHLYDPDYEGPFKKTTRGTFEADHPRDRARVRSLYRGEVYFADRLFGEFVEEIRELGLAENSLIVLTSDHGEEFWEHGGSQHGRVTEEHLRIPLLIYHPDVRRQGHSEVLYSNADLLPTLLGVVGQSVPEILDGRNLVSIQREPSTVLGMSLKNHLSIRTGPLKLIRTCRPEPALALYDLDNDPGETKNLAASQRKSVRELRSLMATILGGEPCSVLVQAMRGTLPTRDLDEESIKVLRALGYLGD